MGDEPNSELERRQSQEEASATAGAAQIEDQGGPLARVPDPVEAHAGAWSDRLRIGDEPVEQGRVPTHLSAGEATQRGRIIESALGRDPPADDSVEARPRKRLFGLQRMAGITFLIGALAAPRLLRLDRAGGNGAGRG